MEFSLKEICAVFDIETDIEPYGNGHINDTFLCETAPRFILQRINTSIFKNPYQVMENIVNVTEYLRKKIEAYGGDVTRETMTVVKTRDGENLYQADENNFFRMYTFVEDTVTYETVENPVQLYHAGKAFGKFQKMLDSFPADKLYETIPDFHNTGKRYSNLVNAIEKDPMDRVKELSEEIGFCRERRDETYVLTGKTVIGDLPLRVTHNDTKLNNILFDMTTNEPICIVDLDTVMPGLSLYDFGDAIRFGANTAAEDEKDVSKVSLDLNLYEQYVRGFLTSAGNSLVSEEVKLLPFSAKMMTLECGMRFLTDYIDGDVYFKIHYPDHNLVRCHTQFALVKDIEAKFEEMMQITAKAYKEICGKDF